MLHHDIVSHCAASTSNGSGQQARREENSSYFNAHSRNLRFAYFRIADDDRAAGLRQSHLFQTKHLTQLAFDAVPLHGIARAP